MPRAPNAEAAQVSQECPIEHELNMPVQRRVVQECGRHFVGLLIGCLDGRHALFAELTRSMRRQGINETGAVPFGSGARERRS